jgi:hypothetical protein
MQVCCHVDIRAILAFVSTILGGVIYEFGHSLKLNIHEDVGDFRVPDHNASAERHGHL